MNNNRNRNKNKNWQKKTNHSNGSPPQALNTNNQNDNDNKFIKPSNMNTNNNTKQNGKMRKQNHNTEDIENEIQSLQQEQGMELNRINNNGNTNDNSYTKDNPSLRGYKPQHSHTHRNKMLTKPSSFVSGKLANDVNEYEKHMPIEWNNDHRRTNHNYELNKQDYYYQQSNYNYYGNGRYNDGYHDNDNNYDSGYTRQRNNYNTKSARYDAINNTHNENIHYGLNQ